MIEEMAAQNGQSAQELKHETEFLVCDTLRCYICIKRFKEKVADNNISGSTVEKEYLATQLKKHHGNISKTADFIGMERSALHRKLKSLGIKGIN